MVANTARELYEENSGYYGQRIVLEAQMMGLNTCWVGGTFSKGKCRAAVENAEKLLAVIAINQQKFVIGLKDGTAEIKAKKVLFAVLIWVS